MYSTESIINVIFNLWIQLILYLEVKSHTPPFYRGGKSLEVSGWLDMSTAYSDLYPYLKLLFNN